VAAEKFCGAVNDQVCAEFDGLLVSRRSESIVDNHDRFVAMGGGCQAGEVDYFDGGIGRALQINNLATFTDCGFDCFVVVGIAEFDFDAEARQKFEEEFVGAAVGVLDGDDAVAGGKQREERVADGRHTARETGGSFGVFEVADFFFERGHGGVGVARVNMSGGLTPGYGLPVIDVVVAERDAESYGNLRGALPMLALLSGPDRTGSGMRLVRVAISLLQKECLLANGESYWNE